MLEKINEGDILSHYTLGRLQVVKIIDNSVLVCDRDKNVYTWPIELVKKQYSLSRNQKPILTK